MKMTSKWRQTQKEEIEYLIDQSLSYQTKPTKQFLPKQTYQAISTKPKPQTQIYQAKPPRPNLPNLTF